MEMLLLIAAKSLLVAGVALLLLRLASRRSAAERSWIAHLGLLALLLLPIAALSLPAINVAAPEFLNLPAAEQPAATPQAAGSPVIASSDTKEGALAADATFPAVPATAAGSASVELAISGYWAALAYAGPALVLFLFTVIALCRLFTLRSRAEVLVEPHWLTALARAQQRMGFKHGTALLTSDELPSPISWGVFRPVILLNREAANSHVEAEAIIAHELAHVANLDWAKLMLSRVVVAIFWFNPLVWMLSREAHQLREEAADDAVLGADIVDTDYAQLLVGVARHECRGLLIGAHGVAPGRNSLSRRVKRVLDAGSARGPAAGSFAAGVFVGAFAFAAPLAAVTLGPKTSESEPAPVQAAAARAVNDPGESYYAGDEMPLARRTVQTAMNAVTGTLSHPHPGWSQEDDRKLDQQIDEQVDEALDRGWSGYGPRPGTVGPRPGTVGPRPGTVGPRSGTIGPNSVIERAIEMKAVGLTPDYIRSIRAAAPHLANRATGEFVPLAALGVRPEYIRELAAAGYRGLTADQLVEARALGIRGEYIRALAAAGYRNLDLDQLAELRALGVTGAYIEKFRRAGHTRLTVDQLVEMKALGISPEDLYGDGP